MNKCRECGFDISSKPNNKFCNRSCAVSFNNKGVRRHGKAPKDCLMCKKKLDQSSRKYCSNKCQIEYQNEKYINRWIEGKNSGGSADKVSNFIKPYLIEKTNNTCSICNLSTWRGKPIPLILDHIDGNPTDHSVGNLRLVCGNCDMQLPTYKNKNKGNGRSYRRERYAEGKSY